MRILVIAAAVLALTAASVQAQGRGRGQPNEAYQKSDNKPKVDEKAYKAALESAFPSRKRSTTRGAGPVRPSLPRSRNR